MPPFNLLLLPLLGGFVFVHRWYPTRYSTLRAGGHRLILTAAIAGAVFLSLATFLAACAQSIPFAARIDSTWHHVVPYAHSGKATVAFLFGVILWWPANGLGRWFPALSDGAAVDRAIRRKQDPLEMLFRRALGSGRTIAVTVRNGKVYIGKLQSNLNPAFPMESVSLLLSRSGYRDNETRELVLTVDYDATHQKIKAAVGAALAEEVAVQLKRGVGLADAVAAAKKKTSRNLDVHNYEMVIPVPEIQSVNFFDPEIYDRHFKPTATPSAANTEESA